MPAMIRHPPSATPSRVEVVSDEFTGKLPVARHRLVYAAVKEELDAGLHALALKTRTPAEAQRQAAAAASQRPAQ